ncbi:MAG TPA: acylphosphatase [Longimicrobiales bacterium]
MRRAWTVSGHVQGVGFRWWTARQAETLGLRGWCRNLPNGDVEVEAEGEAEAVTAFERLLAEGPANARVSSCSVRAAGASPVPAAGFEIRR